MVKYVASKFRGYVYKLNKDGLVSRIYYYPPTGKSGKYPDKVLEIVPWFSYGQGASEKIGEYSPETVDQELSWGNLFLYDTKWVDANSIKITQKKMVIPKDRVISKYNENWKKLVPYREDLKKGKNIPKDLESFLDIDYSRLAYPYESSKNIIRRRSRINPYNDSKRWV